MASTTTVVGKLPRRSRQPTREPIKLRLFEWGFVLPTLVALVPIALSGWEDLRGDFPALLVWFGIVATADLLPVPCWGVLHLTMSLPVLLAAGMIYEPSTVALLAFVGSVDVREFRAATSLRRALFNRSQIAVSVTAASATFHGLGGDVAQWPQTLLVGAAALAVDAALNTLAVTVATSLSTGRSPDYVLVRLFRDSGAEFAIGYVALGLLATLLATVFRFTGSWALVSSLLPLFLARQMFFHGKRLADASRELMEKSKQLLQLTERIAEERRDERLKVSASLHDDVLQPLYKVHLMSQVLRQDLEAGKLLELDEDLPELLTATQLATDETRRLVLNLRKSPLGVDGLEPTLQLLMDDLSLETDATIHAEVDGVGGTPLIQLLVYQVAREATQNALRHSRAANVWVRLFRDGEWIRLVVRDDGVGFDPQASRSSMHFGLDLMRERTEAAGGMFSIDSGFDRGTQVSARFPQEARLDETSFLP